MKHIDDLTGCGRRLRETREARGLSQRQLAFEGCSAAYISRLEAGDRQASEQMLGELARRLGTTVHYLKTGELDPIERGLADAGVALADLTDDERGELSAALAVSAAATARTFGADLEASRTLAERDRLEARLAELTPA